MVLQIKGLLKQEVFEIQMMAIIVPHPPSTLCPSFQEGILKIPGCGLSLFLGDRKPLSSSDLNRNVYFSHVQVWRVGAGAGRVPLHCRIIGDLVPFISLLRHF